MIDLRSKRVVISGGGTGIGLECAHMLVEQGAQVALLGRRAEALEAAAADLGEGAQAWPCDVSDPEAVAAVADRARDHWGAVDGLVNNAGIAPMASLDDTSNELWEQVFAINVRGPFLLCRDLGPLLREGRSASVVNISSTLAERAIPGMAGYNASKAALNQMTRSLALEWAPQIRVNAVMPAVVDTPIHSGRGMSSDDVQQLGSMHPMGRVGLPADIASMVLYLLSEKAAWMTGTVIPVDGGVLAS